MRNALSSQVIPQRVEVEPVAIYAAAGTPRRDKPAPKPAPSIPTGAGCSDSDERRISSSPERGEGKFKLVRIPLATLTPRAVGSKPGDLHPMEIRQHHGHTRSQFACVDARRPGAAQSHSGPALAPPPPALTATPDAALATEGVAAPLAGRRHPRRITRRRWSARAAFVLAAGALHGVRPVASCLNPQPAAATPATTAKTSSSS